MCVCLCVCLCVWRFSACASERVCHLCVNTCTHMNIFIICMRACAFRLIVSLQVETFAGSGKCSYEADCWLSTGAERWRPSLGSALVWYMSAVAAAALSLV